MEKFCWCYAWEISESYSSTLNPVVYFYFGVSVKVCYAIAENYNIVLFPFVIFYYVAVQIFS